MVGVKRDEYPEQGELVIATVQNIFKHGAFVTLDEYGNKRGLLHLSEISLKWVRNIRDYVREGQKVVLLVLRVNPERGHIDLSLRRVTDAQRKAKLQQVKREQRANKLLDLLADELSLPRNKVKEAISNEILKRFDTLYDGLEAILIDNKIIDELNINEDWKPHLLNLIKNSIKLPYVEVTGYVKLQSYEPNGIDIIRNALDNIVKYDANGYDDYKISVKYVSAPLYSIKVIARDYKSAEKILRDAANEAISYIKRNNGIGEFHRKLDEAKRESE
ncbi:MAG: translation initiation factor IF-2 subunit alpha [Candidatus Altiarchaeales archaeon]|nr:MAG: translation initiation factor IF-2 subunit alpha [Candidatus Altiarchaeales archaeon]RLI93484.1 MAG: translation initiation factor IF-2 subunit alpha [Candidatus Altiarchaeales archaeon]RLI94588.1 MAG: translation initiation factor IF-2 subunit alpha [Candidatus Altiarchaeales archaeon]HDO82782.1 translation initiation factor IF-2 subunit alpha [Candidatus Altiarchaeales archaeon]HEX55431.1 translation initiation factor IF-2 subunit alpha [Candidatus Altiarchaeales archaeon]